jgi:transcriptional regulator with XRE-family HTH domain
MNKQDLRMRRILQGLSQAEVARRIGKSMAWVSLVERGYLHPTPEMVTAIWEALELKSHTR